MAIFERIPVICTLCGRIGHTLKKCPSATSPDAKIIPAPSKAKWTGVEVSAPMKSKQAVEVLSAPMPSSQVPAVTGSCWSWDEDHITNQAQAEDAGARSKTQNPPSTELCLTNCFSPISPDCLPEEMLDSLVELPAVNASLIQDPLRDIPVNQVCCPIQSHLEDSIGIPPVRKVVILSMLSMLRLVPR